MAAVPVEAVAKASKEDIKLKINKSCISEFFNSETLSDITVVNPQTGAQYK